MTKTTWGLGPTAAKYARMLAYAAVVLGVTGIVGLSARGNVPLGLGGVERAEEARRIAGSLS